MSFDLFSPIVLDIQIWVSFDPILEWCQNEGLGMGHKTIVTELDRFITFRKGKGHK